VPNVTAIDCEQADVYGQKLRAYGGMSFTVQEARAAFFSYCFNSLTRITLAAQKNLRARLLAKQRGAQMFCHELAAPAT